MRSHWPEYACEAALLGTFMFVACALAVVLENPAGAVHHAVPDPFTRRAAFGAAMGLTAVALVHSPWGKRSGAHLNPAVTLSFAWLRRVRPEDAAPYAVAQFAGASVGVAAAWAVFGARLAHPSIHFVVTRPGEAGVLLAFAAEVAMSFVLMATVLLVSGSRRPELTGACAGALVFLYITFEAPISGMSLNPARSFGAALVAADFDALWVYFTAPPLGMVGAAALLRGRVAGCAKLRHTTDVRCIFCGRGAGQPATTLRGPPLPALPR